MTTSHDTRRFTIGLPGTLDPADGQALSRWTSAIASMLGKDDGISSVVLELRSPHHADKHVQIAFGQAIHSAFGDWAKVSFDYPSSGVPATVIVARTPHSTGLVPADDGQYYQLEKDRAGDHHPVVSVVNDVYTLRYFYDSRDEQADLVFSGLFSSVNSRYSRSSIKQKPCDLSVSPAVSLPEQADIDIALVGNQGSFERLFTRINEIPDWRPQVFFVGTDAITIAPNFTSGGNRFVQPSDVAPFVYAQIDRLPHPPALAMPDYAAGALKEGLAEISGAALGFVQSASPADASLLRDSSELMKVRDRAFSEVSRPSTTGYSAALQSPTFHSSDRAPQNPLKRKRLFGIAISLTVLVVGAATVVALSRWRWSPTISASTHPPINPPSSNSVHPPGGDNSQPNVGAAADPSQAPPNCRRFGTEQWSRVRALDVYELTSNPRQPGSLARARRMSLSAFATLDNPAGRPSVIVFGQASCRPCMEELPSLGFESQLHAADVRIAVILLEPEWRADDDSTPYMSRDYAVRIGLSGVRIAASSLPEDVDFDRLLGTGASFPSFLYLDGSGNPNRFCLGSIVRPTPEGEEFKRWINTASLRIPSH